MAWMHRWGVWGVCVCVGAAACGSPASGTGTEGAATTGAAASDGSGGDASDGSGGAAPTSGGSAQATGGPGGDAGDTTAAADETGAPATSTGGPTSAPGDTTADASSGAADASSGGTTAAVDDTGASTGAGTEGSTTGDDTTTGDVPPSPLWDEPNLWYAVDKALVYIALSPVDGSVVQLVSNALVADAPLVHGQNGLTMLEGGALLGSRESAQGTQIYYVPEPPITADTPAAATLLGTVPNDGQPLPIRVEALYTDCDGRVYLMDTGADVTNAVGNRLLRFTGDYLAGDLAFEVITDLQNASVGDIDDMSPGIVMGEINDSLGFAQDTGSLWQIDYTTGTGMKLANTKGTYGVHALGAPLFDDATPRLYVLSAGTTSIGPDLYRVDLDTYASSPSLVTGPNFMLQTGSNGWSGLAGPLTECMTTIPQ